MPHFLERGKAGKKGATKETEGVAMRRGGSPGDSGILETKGKQDFRRRQLSAVSNSLDLSDERKVEIYLWRFINVGVTDSEH